MKEIPHTATGKINKLKLREMFKGYKLPTAEQAGGRPRPTRRRRNNLAS